MIHLAFKKRGGRNNNLTVMDKAGTKTYVSGAAQQTWVVVKMTVEEFLEGGMAFNGNVWMAPIIAAKVA